MDDRLSILVVDDYPLYLNNLASVLHINGFKVHKAHSGAEALEFLEAHPVDILLTDIKMPGMNGVELYRETKKIRPAIAAVLMTAYAEDELIQQGRAEGVKAILDKPLDIEFLLTLFRSIKKINSKSY
jgi:two-component system, NtrC family, response regulator HydG